MDAGLIQDLAASWNVAISRCTETSTSVLAYGVRAGRRVVLKVSRVDDEQDGGAVAAAFGGRGMVGVLEHTRGAVLLEELRPGDALTTLVAGGRDIEAAEILAGVVSAMTAVTPAVTGWPTVESWGAAFERHLDTGDPQIPAGLVREARARFQRRCRLQRSVRPLHGDLHHDNVLFDTDRGWVAVDPKGVIGELEYEFGAALRNPNRLPARWSADMALRRIAAFSRVVDVDEIRVLEWAFAQAVLSCIWTIEDDGPLPADAPALRLARALQPTLP